MKNPTRTALDEVGITYHSETPLEDNGLGKIETYRQQDSRFKFMSVLPVSSRSMKSRKTWSIRCTIIQNSVGYSKRFSCRILNPEFNPHRFGFRIFHRVFNYKSWRKFMIVNWRCCQVLLKLQEHEMLIEGLWRSG